MLIKNGELFVDGAFRKLDMRVENGYISAIGECMPAPDEKIVDASGKLVLPGLVEIHSHGCVGYDFSNADEEGVKQMCSWYAAKGVTTVLATTMTNEYESYKKAVKTIAQVRKQDYRGSRIAGINMEGPFLGEDKKGAHDPKYLMGISEEVFEELDGLADHCIRLVDLDPKLPGALPFIEKYSKTKTISIAHTSCDYELAREAVRAGAKHVTHLFNAMDGLHHRKPGIVGAVMDEDVYAELICDGIHIHPAVIRLMFSAVPEKMVLISDSMCAAGLPDGEYELGGLKVYVKDRKAAQEDGTIAGSTTNVWEAMQNVIRFGVSREKAILSATLYPAKSVGIEKEAGVLAAGRAADFCIANQDLSLEAVYLSGILHI